MADAVAISSTPFSGEGGRGAGGLIQTLAISEGEMDRRQANNKEELKTFTQFPHMTFKRLQLWHNMWLTFFSHPLYRGCVCMCQACVPNTGNQTSTPGCVCAVAGFLELHKATFYFKLFSFLLLLVFWCFFFCPTLGVPPVVCHAKIAQLLLHRQRS